jgi:hypothetical protein
LNGGALLKATSEPPTAQMRALKPILKRNLIENDRAIDHLFTIIKELAGDHTMIGRCALAAIALLAVANQAQAAGASPWNGVWVGALSKSSKISVTIVDNKAVDYSYRGADLPVAYSKVGANTFSFGDGVNYSMLLKRTDDHQAIATYHGRHGLIAANLVKQ